MITFIESGNRIATENFETGEIYTITYTNETIRTMCCIGIGSDFVMFQGKTPNTLFCLTLGTSETVLTIDLGGGGGSTMNYNELENKPQINGIVLIGNKTSSDLGLLSQSDLDNYVTDTELTTELVDYATNASVVSALASKQDQLTTPQLTAVNSGITNSLVTQIGTNTTAIAGKQDTLTTPQLTAVNSGITNSLVTQIGTNTTAIAGKQDTLTPTQLTAVNSGITSSLVTQITTNQNNISLKQDKTWVQLKNVTTTTETFELDLRGKSEFKIVLIHNTDIYEASAPVDLIAAGFKLIVSHINSATPSTDIGTFVYNFSAQGTDDFTATIPSTSYNLLIFAR